MCGREVRSESRRAKLGCSYAEGRGSKYTGRGIAQAGVWKYALEGKRPAIYSSQYNSTKQGLDPRTDLLLAGCTPGRQSDDHSFGHVSLIKAPNALFQRSPSTLV